MAGTTSFERITPPTHANPILSAMQFATNTQRQGGATQNLATGRLLKGNKRIKDPATGQRVEVPGTADSGYIVSGEPDRSGARIPTRKIPRKEATPMMALHERARLQETTDSPNASLGWWRDQNTKAQKVESDASAVYNDRRVAKQVGRRRGEKAIWSNHEQREIRLDE